MSILLKLNLKILKIVLGLYKAKEEFDLQVNKNKGYNSGIYIAQHNRITSTNVPKITPYIRILQILFILFGVYGTIFGFITALNIPVVKKYIIISMILSAIYFYYILQLNKIIKYILPITTCVYLMAVFEFYKEIQNGFWHIENIYIDYINDYFGLKIYPFIVEDYTPKTVITIFIIFASILLSFVVSSVILSNNIRGIFFLITLPIYSLPIFVGIIPRALPSILYFICCICIIGMGTAMRRYSNNQKVFHSNKKQVKKHRKKNIGLEKKFRYIIGFKIGAFLGGILLLLIAISTLMLPKKTYEEKYHLTDVKEKIQNELMNLSFDKVVEPFEHTKLSEIQLFKQQSRFDFGGLDGGDLGDHGEVTFDNKAVLKVEMPVNHSTVYLKGFVGSNYYGDKWGELTYAEEEEYSNIAKLWKKSDFEIGNQSAHFLSIIEKLDASTYPSLQFHKNEIRVSNVRSNTKYAYAPYYTNFDGMEDMNLLNQEYVTPNNRKENYTFSYYTLFNNLFMFDSEKEYQDTLQFYKNYEVDSLIDEDVQKELEEYRKYELSYRDFVYNTYTKLPSKGLDRLKQDINLMKYKNDDSYSLSDKISYVRYYLWNNTSYSLKPGVLPKGKDYIEYFLYENKLGYCAHYASAATMMLRSMGIPARYAEGYVVKSSNMDKGKIVSEGDFLIRGEDEGYKAFIKEVDVLDSNAHAWVEIYIDGYGWVPVECTPGYSFSEENDIATMNPVTSPSTPTVTPTISPETEEEEDTSNENPSDVEEKEPPKATTKPTENPDREYDNINSATSDKPSDTLVLDSQYQRKLGTIIARILLILFGVIFALFLRWLLGKMIASYKLKISSTDHKIIIYYKEMLRVLSYMGISLDESVSYEEAAKKVEEECDFFRNSEFTNIINITLKAKFGYRKPKEAEVEIMENMHHAILHELYKNKSSFRKWYYKYVKLLG